MYHTAGVGVGERIGHLLQHLRDVFEGGSRLAHDARGQTLARHERHGETHQSTRLVHRIDRHDVWMIQPRCRLRLAHEAFTYVAAERQFGGQHLERDQSLQPHILGCIHHGHATAADFLTDKIEVPDRRRDTVSQKLRFGSMLRRLYGRSFTVGHRSVGLRQAGAR